MSNVSGLFKDLTTVKKARNGRLASWDQRGKNQDYWEIPAGETISLGEVEGPGCITHIWMTSSCRKVVAPSILDPVLNASAAPVMEIHPALGVIWDDYDPFYYRKVLIKITWDDQDTPSVLAPLGDFFCIGNSYPGNFSSLPFNVSLKPEEAGRYGAPCSVSCYFPMPFNKKAKIEIVQEKSNEVMEKAIDAMGRLADRPIDMRLNDDTLIASTSDRYQDYQQTQITRNNRMWGRP